MTDIASAIEPRFALAPKVMGLWDMDTVGVGVTVRLRPVHCAWVRTVLVFRLERKG